MKTKFLKVIYACAILLLQAGCQALAAPSSTPTPAPLSGPRASAAGASALVQYQEPGTVGVTLAPVDAGTGRLVDGFAPINLGYEPDYAFSADRERLAFASTIQPSCTAKCLHILDLRTWKETLQPPLPLDPDGSLYAVLAFDPAGTKLAVALNDAIGPGAQLLLVDLAQAKVIRQVKLDASVMQLGFTPAGALAVYGMQAPATPTVSQGTPPVPPENHMYAALYDGASLQELWRQELDNVSFGNDEAGMIDPTQGRWLNPAAVFSPDYARLYVLPADLPELVSVDFAARTVQTFEIGPRQGLLERLLTAGASVAYAKALNGASKNAAISPDGKTLYVVAQTNTAVKDASGGWTSQQTMLGLQVVDVSDGTELGSLASEAWDVRVGLDGRSILLTGVDQVSDGTYGTWTDLVDAAALKVVQRFKGDVTPSRLLDGETALLSLVWTNSGANTVAVYDPASFTLRSQRTETSDNYAAWLPVP